MGWTSFNLTQPIKEWFSEYWGNDYNVLDSALVKRNTLYGAIEEKSTGEVFCAVFLIRWSRDYYNFSYKSMTEHVGPYEFECPKRIMKLLTPLNEEDQNGYAGEWRKSVNEYWKKKELMKKPNLCFKTQTPLTFTDGSELQYFRKINKTMFGGFIDGGIFKPLCRVRIDLSKHEIEPIECSV